MTEMPERVWPFVPLHNRLFDELEIVRGDGCYLYTRDGRRLLDASAGAAVGNIGWGRQEVVEAAAASLGKLTYALPPFATPERTALARTLVDDWLPGHMPGISFFGSGSEANEAAMRLARQYQIACGRGSRWKTVGRDVSYNGTTLATLSVGGHAARRRDFEPMLPHSPHAPACYCLRCPFDLVYPGCAVACARALEAVIEREGAGTIAAFLAEPITGTSGGALVPPEGYWAEITRVCREHDILLIADEVLTGFGRTGTRMGGDHFALEPDIVVLGKGMSGGYAALSAVACRREIGAALDAAGITPMFHTYGGHPAQCAAASKVLEIIERERLVDRVRELGPAFGAKLGTLRSLPQVADVRGRGFFWAVEIVADPDGLQRFPAAAEVTVRVMEAAAKRGVLTYFGGTGEVRDIINLSPHFTMDLAEADVIVAALGAAIEEVCIS